MKKLVTKRILGERGHYYYHLDIADGINIQGGYFTRKRDAIRQFRNQYDQFFNNFWVAKRMLELLP